METVTVQNSPHQQNAIILFKIFTYNRSILKFSLGTSYGCAALYVLFFEEL